MMNRNMILFLLLFTTSAHEQQNSVVGTWQVNLESTIELMDSGLKERYDTLPGHIKAQADGSMTGKTFTFNQNGSVTIQWNVNAVAKTASGTWQLTSGGSRLVVAVGGLEIEYQVEWEGNDGLILRNTKAGGLFTNLYLEKID